MTGLCEGSALALPRFTRLREISVMLKTAAFLPPFSAGSLAACVGSLLSVALFGCTSILVAFFFDQTRLHGLIFTPLVDIVRHLFPLP